MSKCTREREQKYEELPKVAKKLKFDEAINIRCIFPHSFSLFHVELFIYYVTEINEISSEKGKKFPLSRL